MTDSEIKAGFLALDPQHTFFKAVVGLLEQLEQAESDMVAAADLTDGARHYNAGRLATAKNAKELVLDTMKQAHEEEAMRRAKEMQREERSKSHLNEHG